jgi:hypothetical protein
VLSNARETLATAMRGMDDPVGKRPNPKIQWHAQRHCSAAPMHWVLQNLRSVACLALVRAPNGPGEGFTASRV